MNQDKGFVAVLLPLQSKSLQSAADAIRAGVLAAEQVYTAGTLLPVRIYETSGNEEEVLSQFNLAKSQGARAVIGPLTRPAMNFLADSADLSIPVLALNSFDGMTLRRNNLYSLSLSIEAEVQQVVRRMRKEQVQAPLVLQTEGPLSQRMQRAFVAEWFRQVGSNPDVLEVWNVKNQTAELASKLAGSDAVFFAADGKHASLIRPYLPSDRSFYATSQIVAGRAVSGDLAGVRYIEVPWLANPDDAEYLAYQRTRTPSNDLERLFALGVDAWRVAQILAAREPLVALNGLSGRIEPGVDGVISRELTEMVASRYVPPSPLDVPNASQPVAITPLKIQ